MIILMMMIDVTWLMCEELPLCCRVWSQLISLINSYYIHIISIFNELYSHLYYDVLMLELYKQVVSSENLFYMFILHI